MSERPFCEVHERYLPCATCRLEMELECAEDERNEPPGYDDDDPAAARKEG